MDRLKLLRAGDVRGGRVRCAPAFTLLEILIVLSLLVLLAAIAWPVMETRITAAELPQSAEAIRSMLFMARSGAVMEHRRYRVRFLPEHQQPIVEYEPDPILSPGEFEPVKDGWASEPVLLADVQVHEVQLGRPIWTKPLSITSEPGEDEEENEKELMETEAEETEFEQGDISFSLGRGKDDEEEFDENRPAIVFEADGSTDWAVFILARVAPEEELEEQEEQIWVLLDGRTGLATIHDKVTEEQLSDPEFYVQREKLELPDLVNVDDLTFEVGGAMDPAAGPSMGGLGAAPTGNPGEVGPRDNGDTMASEFLDEFGDAEKDSGVVGMGEDRGTSSDQSDSNAATDEDEAVKNLEDELADSDLNEEERERVRRSFKDRLR